IVGPCYLLRLLVNSRYFRLLLIGAVPGLALGMFVLRAISKTQDSPVVVIVLVLLLAITSSVTFVPRVQNPTFALKNTRWLPWLAFPIGVESGLSSAGPGALGTVLLLNYSELAPAQVVGPDLGFGLVPASI